MRNLCMALTIVATLAAGSVSWAAEKTVTLGVDNMTCETCPITVKESLAKVPGVNKVVVSFEAKTAVVTFDDTKVGPDSLVSATTNAGYPSHLLNQAQ